MNVVLLGRTYGDAEKARDKWSPVIPDLGDSRLASTFAFRVIDGQGISRVFVAPGTQESSRPYDFSRVVRLLARQLAKTGGADQVILQILDDGKTKPVDVDALRADPLDVAGLGGPGRHRQADS